MVEVHRSTLRLPQSSNRAMDLFTRLAVHFPDAPAAFLDSSDHATTENPQRSRYSILAFSLGPDAFTVHCNGAEDFFSWLEEAWPFSGAPQHLAPGAPVFQLGWVGVLGYDHYSSFFRATHAVVFDHHTGEAEAQSLGPDPGWVRLIEQCAQQQRPSAAEIPVRLSDLQSHDTREDYLQKIRTAQEEIRAGNSYEICLTTSLTGLFHGSSLQAYHQLRQHSPAPFAQYLRTPSQAGGTQELLSTSPERFLQIETSGRARSEPIKGTRARGTDPATDAALHQDLLTHPKDRAENVMIADLVRNDLSVNAQVGSLRTERLCAVETYPTVFQMVSTISAQTDEHRLRADVLRAAFPPGSMTGAPKVSTVKILTHLESVPRGPYSGAAGYFSTTGACELSVLIRTAVLHRSSASAGPARFHLGLGGAITADSDPQDEWEEVITKSRGVLGALGAQFP